MNPESITSRGTIALSIKFIPDGFEGQLSSHTTRARHALLDSGLLCVLEGGGLPLTGELHIWLREAHGLLSHKGGPVDSFVKRCLSCAAQPSLFCLCLKMLHEHKHVVDWFEVAFGCLSSGTGSA